MFKKVWNWSISMRASMKMEEASTTRKSILSPSLYSPNINDDGYEEISTSTLHQLVRLETHNFW